MNFKVLITGGSGFIGTNMVQYYLDKNVDVINIDIAEPRNIAQLQYWKKADICDLEALKTLFNEYSPTHVVHLAAKTDLKGKKLNDYSSNVQGTDNIIKAVNFCKSVKKTIFASSMLVCGVGYVPKNYGDYKPSTIYGESKIKVEIIIKANENMSCSWNIIRPTSIWGPWFSEPYKNFFDFVLDRRFFHPGNKACTKTFGFIGNSVYQIDKLLFAESDKVNKKTFYIGDQPPINISKWADRIAEMGGIKKPIKVPFFIFRIAALIGDFFVAMGGKFPMTSFRLKNITTDNVIDLENLYQVAGVPPFQLENSIKITLKWMLEKKDIRWKF